MAQRTYIHTLIEIGHRLCTYMTRYQEQIRSRLTTDQVAAFDALLLACIAFEAILGGPDIGD